MTDRQSINLACRVLRSPAEAIQGICDRQNLYRASRALGALIKFKDARYIVEGITYWPTGDRYGLNIKLTKAYATDRQFYKNRYQVKVSKEGKITFSLDPARPRRVAK